ncbi:MAG: hypothetical protein PGN21_03475 [Sphingomonas paucimobilis]
MGGTNPLVTVAAVLLMGWQLERSAPDGALILGRQRASSPLSPSVRVIWFFAFFGAMILLRLVWRLRAMPETNGVALEDVNFGGER